MVGKASFNVITDVIEKETKLTQNHSEEKDNKQNIDDKPEGMG